MEFQTWPTMVDMELDQKRNEFVGEEAYAASQSWELWHISKEGGTADSEIVRGEGEKVLRRIEELSGANIYAPRMVRGKHYHNDGYSGVFEADGYTDKDTGDRFYYYPAHRVHSWWEDVDRRMDEAGFPDGCLSDEMRESIRRDIVLHTTLR